MWISETEIYYLAPNAERTVNGKYNKDQVENSKEIYLPSSWAGKTVYVRARYVSNGVNGDWSNIEEVKLKS